ncbi:hypothetical protein CY34DRAFT_351896 [Suillus luteus UH-Slu-Lm8-n1]|uniref:Uncharacterized protein n=1 Tax=Suillus luteus UH-Slu-Lm8-n1 TaxID=930992 RepID=A0A0D0ABD1_9AGAM|nr:hypothetical protein CY34DRAFT_351896 [Suillus luteus UH-Slu-Lm8-n1]
MVIFVYRVWFYGVGERCDIQIAALLSLAVVFAWLVSCTSALAFKAYFIMVSASSCFHSANFLRALSINKLCRTFPPCITTSSNWELSMDCGPRPSVMMYPGQFIIQHSQDAFPAYHHCLVISDNGIVKK